MIATSALQDSFRAASKAAAMSAKEVDFLEMRDWAILAQVKELLEREKKLPRHPLEMPELLFDRLLLTYSRQYLKTRTFAASLGVRLVPELQSIERSIERFDPCADEVFYSPVAGELEWLLRSKRGVREIISMVKGLRGFVSSSYHDLNHAIFFRLVRPLKNRAADREREEIRLLSRYYRWVESLVMVREVQLSEELQKAGVPLHSIGVTYRVLPRPEGEALEKMSLSKFTGLFLYAYFENTGAGHEKIRKEFSLAKRPLSNHQLRETNPIFLSDTSPGWMRQYVAKNGRKVRVPKAAEKGLFKTTLPSPRELLRDSDGQRRFYAWYEKNFGDAGE